MRSVGLFSGLVEVIGVVEEIRPIGPGRRLVIGSPGFFDGSSIGDSIAINGCCLTVVELQSDRAAFDAGSETCAHTTIGSWKRGARVNLERSLQVGARLGGHFVAGHVDGVGILVKRTEEGEWSDFTFDAEEALTRQMAGKGSIAIDGVSLTLVDVRSRSFRVALIPHTLKVTNLGERVAGDRVHLETDILAKYVERQWLAAQNGSPEQPRRHAP